MLEDFQNASGQRINVDNSAVLPARRLTEEEEDICKGHWPETRISYRERLLGIFI